ncbi:hypothetical protein [Nocardioides sp. GXQ0305]|uniref:hypothetical protein n=1 Tax=Nocardioides sp. GXQ0305 TaxID=3423912 RepID=UPI003D7E9961
MRLYAQTPARATRQVAADLFLVLWLLGWTWAGLAVHDATLELAAPGEQLAASATGMSGAMQDAGGALDDVPVVGDEVRAPFDEASGAADRLAEVGRDQVRAVEQLAVVLGLAVAAVPILLGCLIHVPRRVRFVRRASAGARFVDAGEDLDLFALRALAHQPLHVLARISDDPAGAWRRGDREVTDRLAELELRASGLRPPGPVVRRSVADGPA